MGAPETSPTAIQILGAVLFGIALVHTFTVKHFERLAHRYPAHAGLFHLLGEVEVVFGFWAMVLMLLVALLAGPGVALNYAESRQYTEPMFVFVVMVVAASRPILEGVRAATHWAAEYFPGDAAMLRVWLCLALVPLLGSFITEPAAMTIAALTLAPQMFRREVPELPKYLALGALFVNVSIGGTLTSFAAPPVLMVASTWGWDTPFMARTFGWKAAVAVLVNATVVTALVRRHLAADVAAEATEPRAPLLVIAIHAVFLAAIVVLAHHPVAFLGLFLLFLGYARAYERYQAPLIVREALLVAFFLAGLVVLGGMQDWWLQPIVSAMSPTTLFFGTATLTAFTDNAALTYLGSLIPGISDEAKYALVAGAVAGGGLTVIANAPNPAGVALLREGFADGTIGAGGLALGAAFPTVVGLVAFALL
ncbi:MAG TPA: putative Na+/H+ antiporter [Ramlibacter sp.]|uniref:putative Na+/H+ antiporter n=1 Tax=Ramlibacter sp. TaxID=1917967 RepID=UPI002D7F2B93|nr:putative Na+/H+ antiporter [Ramlibacter sp.]HET8745331.1 putative Na+/H+ antiporter [Ramlibacter sp.]